MTKIAVLASFNMDLVMRAGRRPAAGETLQGDFAMHLGGKGFNQAVAARRLGAEVRVAGRVGDDEFGRMFLAALDREGIDRRAVVVDREAGTGVASIIVEPDGTSSIIQAPRANRNAAPADWHGAAGWLDGIDACIANLETNAAAAVALFSEARARRPGVMTLLNAAPAGGVEPGLLSLASVLVVNEVEATHMSGVDATQGGQQAWQAAEALSAPGRTVVLTLGQEGALALRADERLHVPAFAARVVDTTGAGDAFCAALAVSLERRGLAEAVRFANAAGAIACTRHGAEGSMPALAEVERLLATGDVRA